MVEHSTADREVTGSSPVAPLLLAFFKYYFIFLIFFYSRVIRFSVTNIYVLLLLIPLDLRYFFFIIRLFYFLHPVGRSVSKNILSEVFQHRQRYKSNFFNLQ